MKHSLSSKKGGRKRSIIKTSEETVHNTTHPVKGKKRKHSEMSTASDQTISFLTSFEPKPKKRGKSYFIFNL